MSVGQIYLIDMHIIPHSHQKLSCLKSGVSS